MLQWLVIFISITLILENAYAQEDCSITQNYDETDLVDESEDIETTENLSVFNIGNAITQALKANKQYLGAEEAAQRTSLNVEYEQADFEYKFIPKGQLGALGGGTAGTGMTVGGGFEVFKRFQQGTRVSIAPYIYRANKLYNTTLSASINQPLLRGLGYEYNTSRLKAAEYSHRTALRALYMARIKLVLRVLSAMYEIIKQEEIVRFNEQSYERLRGYTAAAQLKEKIGLSDSLDVYRAETELHHAEDSLTGAQERLQDSYDIFRELLSLPMDLPLRIEVPVVFHSTDIDDEQAIKTAISSRIEMEQATDTVHENMRLLRWSKQNLLPDLNLVLNWSNWSNDQVFTQAFDGQRRQSTWNIGFTTASDLSNQSEQLLYDNSVLNLEAAQRNLEQAAATITLDVKRAMRTLRQADKRISLQEEQIKTAEGELHLSQIKFKRGFANNFDVIQAERNLRTAHIAYLSAVIEHINGEYILLSAVGKLADKPCF
jgi:outer membrane protein